MQMSLYYVQKTLKITKKLLELINKFSKILVYKINMQKFVTFLYAYNGLFEKEIKKIIPF